MTTINNLTIEQMREIVEGAPTWAKTYFIGIESYDKASSNLSDAVNIAEFRTVIEKYELSGNSGEFKVGDLVVFVNSKSDDENLYAVEAVLDDGAFLGISHYRQAFSANKIRHATPEEIKAGHRLEAERHG